MSAQDNMTAILAAINAQFTTPRAYDLDKVPSPRPAEYIEVTLSRRFGGGLTLGASTRIVGYRVTVRAVSQVSVSNARAALEKCRSALEFKRIHVGADEVQTTPIQFETEDPAAYDDGWFSGLVVFTYAL